MNKEELEKAYLATPEHLSVMVIQEITQFFVTETRQMEDRESKANERAKATPEYKAWVEAIKVDNKQRRREEAEKQKREAEAIQDAWDKEEAAKAQERKAEANKKALEASYLQASAIRNDEVAKANAKRDAAVAKAENIWGEGSWKAWLKAKYE